MMTLIVMIVKSRTKKRKFSFIFRKLKLVIYRTKLDKNFGHGAQLYYVLRGNSDMEVSK